MRLFLLIVLSIVASLSLADTEYPGRDKYPEVSTIELDALHQRYQNNEVVIVDVRSHYEYQTLRINGAFNIPVALPGFGQQLQALRESTDKTIVFYCNGKTCLKSYKAGLKAIEYQVDNTVAFDAGIFDWAKAYPADSALLGQTPLDPSKLISKADLEKHYLKPAEFVDTVELNSHAMVIDVRDVAQSRNGSIFMLRDKRIALDDEEKLIRYIKKAKRKNQPILFYDQAGKQVRWLQYFLVQQGLHDYFFMKGGASAYFKYLIESQSVATQ